MSKRYSALSLAVEGLRGHTGWGPAWRCPQPQPAYDVVIIGGGGHGLAAAYYLAKLHGIRRVAVLEKGWLGGGNTGRNTTVVRSNYFYPESVALYDLALRLYEGLSRDLNYNVMLSPARHPQRRALRRARWRSARVSPTPCRSTASTPSCSAPRTGARASRRR